jgi:phage terminase large subunit
LSSLAIPTAEVFEPLLLPSRYKGAWGGRGSGKSHFFAGLIVEDSLRERGLRSVCIREVQKSLKDSAKRLIEQKLIEFGLGEAHGFKVFREAIETPGDGAVIFQGMQDHTAESIKSLEGFNRAWVEEAQSLSSRSLTLLRPTIRGEGSEIWFSWNPRRKTDPVDQLCAGQHSRQAAQLFGRTGPTTHGFHRCSSRSARTASTQSLTSTITSGKADT